MNNRKLESIGKLASGIAHEINTPMQYLGDNATFLKVAVSDLLLLQKLYRQVIAQLGVAPGIALALLEKIKAEEARIDPDYLEKETILAITQSLEGIERVNGIVGALKDFGRQSLHGPSMADVNRGIQNTLLISRREWKYVAELTLDLVEPSPMVYCQIDEIDQVILNLIVNSAHAIKANIDVGTYEMGKITIQTSIEHDFFIIRVTDDGTGIAPENLSRIFDPFFTTKEPGKGTGQGLAISREIIEKNHSGKMSVSSEPGKGTTFQVYLPMKSTPDRHPDNGL